MQRLINNYIKTISVRYGKGISTEHSYRGDLQNLMEVLLKQTAKNISITNEPQRQSCGAPDYIVQRGDLPIGYIEAKDINANLNEIENSEQLNRYRESLHNLILTDYLDFRFYRYGEKVFSIRIGDIDKGKIKPIKGNFDTFIEYIKEFVSFAGEPIKSTDTLVKIMARKARLMKDVIYEAIRNSDEDNSLREQFETFKEILIPGLKEESFADIYAQTITYGLFAARLHDKTKEDFSRQEALFLVPKSNPFLRKLFTYIAGPDLDSRVVWIVDDLSDIFKNTDIDDLLNYFDEKEKDDPFIYFYESFLSEYDSKLRKSRGVFYTPLPVVKFIVKGVDTLLSDYFNLKDGIASTEKTEIKIEDKTIGKNRTKQVHKVQILDPATGTGTFLAEVIKQIYKKMESQKGLWSSYVERELIPRLNGFEILMAPYTMCHLKIEMLLNQLGYDSFNKDAPPRLRVFLTNSLEEIYQDKGTVFAKWLSKESGEAHIIKKETPIMVVMGNPPYSVSSSNKGHWITGLLRDYKKNLNERKINLDDDYIKFIRYGHYYIEKNKEGILAYISNNSFVDGVTHRQMRKSLLETFDKIYILNLHGDVRKKEKTRAGEKDENVFDIMQGVSINIFIKKNEKNRKKKDFAEVFYYDLYGTREYKYDFLNNNSIETINWQIIEPKKDLYYFAPRDYKTEEEYKKGFAVTELFNKYNSGIETQKDSVAIQFTDKEINEVLNDFRNLEEYQINEKYGIKGNKLINSIEDIKKNKPRIIEMLYRPFDMRKTIWTGRTNGIMGRPRTEVMRHFIDKENVGIITVRFQSTFNFQHIFVSILPIERCAVSVQTKETSYFFPLYIYEENEESGMEYRTVNFNKDILSKIENNLNLKMKENCEDKDRDRENCFKPIDLVDYIYAVLHSEKYREKYKEYLKTDFPRVPYPKDKDKFFRLVKIGAKLRNLHLLKDDRVNEFITAYPQSGDNKITKKIVKKDFEITDKENKVGRIWINNEQYFDGIPEDVWNFYIGGYQPAQKYLKSRIGRILTYDEILHYQRMIKSLYLTIELMREIDEVM